MFRRWLSNFIRKNREKIRELIKVLAIGALVVFVIYAIFSNGMLESDTPTNQKEAYRPQETIISGKNIKDEDYEQDSNIVKIFVQYCNEQKIKEAYDLLTEECKKKMYPNIEEFYNKYYKMIFEKNREYSIQSWVSESGYNTYKIRFTDDFMTTGNYTDSEKYEDYITTITEGDNKRININGYVKTNTINKTTETDKLKIDVLNEDIYTDYVIYTMKIKNLTEKNILLDNLTDYSNVKLIGSNSASYKLNTNNLMALDLEISANERKNVTLRFSKVYGSDVLGDIIQFKQVITDYSSYRQDSSNYKEYEELNISL